jgi:hypothetical protein
VREFRWVRRGRGVGVFEGAVGSRTVEGRAGGGHSEEKEGGGRREGARFDFGWSGSRR